MAANVVRPATVSCGTEVARSDRRKKRSSAPDSTLAGFWLSLAVATTSVICPPSDLILRSARRARLEGWRRARRSRPSFETAATRPPQDEVPASPHHRMHRAGLHVQETLRRLLARRDQ